MVEVLNMSLENEKMGAYITYNADTLPDFLVWQMFGESEYVIGLEPRTTSMGGQNMLNNNKLVNIQPMEEYTTKFEIELKDL